MGDIEELCVFSICPQSERVCDIMVPPFTSVLHTGGYLLPSSEPFGINKRYRPVTDGNRIPRTHLQINSLYTESITSMWVTLLLSPLRRSVSRVYLSRNI